MSESEKMLLEKAKKGDVEAFETLIETHQKKVYNIALRMLGNQDDASELAQEVFIKVYKSIRNFKEESSFSTWIYKITTNVCLDELRKRKRSNIVSIDEDMRLEEGDLKRQIEDRKPSPDLIAERNEIKRALQEAISGLSEEHRLVIVLRDLQGFSYEEISKMIKSPEGTVKSRLNRARQSLKEILLRKKELFKEDFVK